MAHTRVPYLSSMISGCSFSIKTLHANPVQAWASAGTLGFTNSRKKTTHAAEAVAGHMADKVMSCGNVWHRLRGSCVGAAAAVHTLRPQVAAADDAVTRLHPPGGKAAGGPAVSACQRVQLPHPCVRVSA